MTERILEKQGLSFSHFLSIVAILIVTLTGWVSLNATIAANQASTEVRLKALELSRVEAFEDREINRIENKQDNLRIMDKLDALINDVNKIK